MLWYIALLYFCWLEYHSVIQAYIKLEISHINALDYYKVLNQSELSPQSIIMPQEMNALGSTFIRTRKVHGNEW